MSASIKHQLALSAPNQAILNAHLTAWAKRFGPRFVLGLSGGGDSLALALGCASWMELGQGHVHVVCVDHGLRDGSTQEARQTIIWANALGLDGEVVTLDLDRTQNRVQERARSGRHRALQGAAKSQSSRLILLAHNQDDQCETLALRLASKTGLDGLAGMQALTPSPFYEDAWPCLVGRPLLGMRGAGLRDDLTRAHQSWHEDPSNTNEAFGRIRARRRLCELAAAGGETTKLMTIAHHATHMRQFQEKLARDLLKIANMTINGTKIELSYTALLQAPIFVRERAVGWLATALGRVERMPDSDKVARLAHAITQPDFKRATLAGTMFYRANAVLIAARAPPRMGGAHALLGPNSDTALRLMALSGDLDAFVT